MKVFSAISLLLLFLGQLLYLPGVLVWMDWNRDYIADELCENRFEPELMCSGRCYIGVVTAKAIDTDNSDEAPAPGTQEEKSGFSPYLQSDTASIKAFAATLYRPAFHQLDEAGECLSDDIFHPPC